MAADGESVDALYDRLQNLEAAYEQQREELQTLKQQREAGLLARMQDLIGQLDPSLDRRETLKTAGLATAYVASGASLGAAATYALTQPAAADAVGEMGTQADPWTKVWTHELGVGDGATEIALADTLVPATASTQSLGTSSLPWAEVVTDVLTVNNLASEDPRKLVSLIDVSGQSSISESVSITSDENFYHVIEVLRYEDDNSSEDNNLTLTVGGLGNGDYNYALSDKGLTATERTAENEWVLIEPTATAASDRHIARWDLFVVGSRPALIGKGEPIFQTQGRALEKGQSNAANANDNPDITFAASASSTDLTLKAAVWQVQDRSAI